MREIVCVIMRCGVHRSPHSPFHTASDDAIAAVAAKLCAETGMVGHEASVAAQVGEYLGPQRDAAATSRGSDATPAPTTSRLVELTVTARADGVRVTDRLLWDVACPAASLAAHAAATVGDAGLGPAVAAALEAALKDAMTRARREAVLGVPFEAAALDRGRQAAGEWGLKVETDAGGWADAT